MDLTDTLTATTTATPVWVDRHIGQYQMSDTACCPETILNVNRSSRWKGSQTSGGANPYMRDSDQLHFDEMSPAVEHEPLLAFAQESLVHYVTEHKAADNVPPFGYSEGYNILRYKPGQAYHAPHTDWAWPQYANRHLSSIIFLNTVTEGGELEFPDLNLKIQAVEGRCVIFPAGWMFTHRSLPATIDRYVFNVFYGFKPQP